MKTDKIIDQIKNEGFANAGQLALTNNESLKLAELCRKYFKEIKNSKNDKYKDYIKASGGFEGITRLPEHDPDLAMLLNKVIENESVSQILKEIMGNDYKIWGINYRVASAGDKGLSLHQDSYGETNLSILLSDNYKGIGTSIFLPGSHLLKNTIKKMNIRIPLILTKYLLPFLTSLSGKQGDISFFFNHTWHGRSPNTTKDNFDAILFSFYPAGAKYHFNDVLSWSEKFLINNKNLYLANLVNPEINTKKHLDGSYEVLNLNSKSSFVLDLHDLKINLKPNKLLKVKFLVQIVRFTSIVAYTIKGLLKK